jgi:hypothetical protein
MTGMIVVRRFPVLPLLAATIALVATGCSAPAGGSPAPTTDPPASVSASPTSGVSAAIDPCALLTGSEIQQFGLQPNGRDTAGGGRACSWYKNLQYTVGIEVFDHAGLAQLSTTGRTITDHPVGSHDGRLVLSTGGGCGVFLAITKTSMVDVDTAGSPSDTQSCQLAEQYATFVEPRLPAEQK